MDVLLGCSRTPKRRSSSQLPSGIMWMSAPKRWLSLTSLKVPWRWFDPVGPPARYLLEIRSLDSKRRQVKSHGMV